MQLCQSLRDIVISWCRNDIKYAEHLIICFEMILWAIQFSCSKLHSYCISTSTFHSKWNQLLFKKKRIHRLELPCRTSFGQVLDLCRGSSLGPGSVRPPVQVRANTPLTPRLLCTWTTLTDSGRSHVVKPSQRPTRLPLLALHLGHFWPSVLSSARRVAPQRSDYPHPAGPLAPCMRRSEAAGSGRLQTGSGCGTGVWE